MDVADRVLKLEGCAPHSQIESNDHAGPGSIHCESRQSRCNHPRKDVRCRVARESKAKVGLEPSSSLNEINDQYDDGNYEQEMDQAAAKVADETKKPENDQDDNYSPEHSIPFG